MHVVRSVNPVEVVADLVFADEGCLGDVYVLPDFHFWCSTTATGIRFEADLRVDRSSTILGRERETAAGRRQDSVEEILKLKRERIDRGRLNYIVVAHYHTMEL